MASNNSISVQTAFPINALVWFSALRSGEEGVTRRVIEDVEPFFRTRNLRFQRYDITSKHAFKDALGEVHKAVTSDGLRPMIHIDMHGSANNGLEISAERTNLSWEQFIQWLRPINKAMENNLCIISGACFGLHAIKPLKIDQSAPFYILIAPDAEVTFGYLEDHLAPFYKEVLESGDLTLAFEQNFASKMKAFFCEKFLMISLMRYIRNHCRGRGLRIRQERLLTEVMRGGIANTRPNRRKMRKRLKAGLKPDQAMLERYVASFMLGKPCNFTMGDLLKMVDSSLHQQNS